MAIIAEIILPGVSKKDYDAVRAAAGWLERSPVGGISHVTWWEGDDCHSLDAWESEETMGAFTNDRLGRAMAAAGVAVEPQVTVHEAHEVFTPQAVKLTV